MTSQFVNAIIRTAVSIVIRLARRAIRAVMRVDESSLLVARTATVVSNTHMKILQEHAYVTMIGDLRMRTPTARHLVEHVAINALLAMVLLPLIVTRV